MAAALLSSTLLFGLGLDVAALYAIGAVIAGQVLALIWVLGLVRRDLAGRRLDGLPEVVDVLNR